MLSWDKNIWKWKKHPSLFYDGINNNRKSYKAYSYQKLEYFKLKNTFFCFKFSEMLSKACSDIVIVQLLLYLGHMLQNFLSLKLILHCSSLAFVSLRPKSNIYGTLRGPTTTCQNDIWHYGTEHKNTQHYNWKKTHYNAARCLVSLNIKCHLCWILHCSMLYCVSLCWMSLYWVSRHPLRA